VSAPAWMKLYVADFIADTLHLSCEERGAYIMLIMHYWRTGGLPDDDEKLARIVGLDAMRWQCVRSALVLLFAARWRHKRIDAELEIASIKSLKATISASKRWKDHREFVHAIASRSHMPSQSQRNANQISDIRKRLFEKKD
jgi:uncharacterized protein YdaU (DUF1376 family)